MGEVLNFIKNNKIKIIVIACILILVAIGTYLFVDYKKKEYSVTEVSNYKYFMLNENTKYGVIDTSGNIIVEPIYDSIKIPNPEKSVFICEKDNNISVLNEKSEKIFTEYDEVTAISINGVVSSLPYEKVVLKYKVNGKYGLIDYTGKVITKPIYEEIKGLENKESELLIKKDGKYGVINSKGAKLIKEEYDSIVADGFYTDNSKYALSGYIIANKTEDGYRYGYINYNLKKVLDAEYNSISRILELDDTKDVYIIASKNGQYGVVKNNKILINYSYQGIEYDKNNKIFELQRNSKYGVCNINGQEIIPVQYKEIEINGIYLKALKNEEERYIYFDVDGNEIKELQYTSMLNTNNNNYYITINADGFYGIVNSKKKELVENKYSYLEYLFGEYFIAAKEDGYLGIINTRDDVLVEFKYEVLQNVDDTNVIEAKILRENKSELYNNKLEKIFSANNIYIYKGEQYIKASSKQEEKYFDFNGKELVNSEIFKNNKLLSSKKEDKWGFVDRTGTVVVDYQYDKVTEFNKYGFAGIRKNNEWGIIDEEGNIIVEPTYSIQETNIEPEFLGKYYKVYYGYGESYYTSQVNE